MLDTSLLTQHMNVLFGYGSATAPYWFIGSEEGGQITEPIVAKRLQIWEDWKKPTLVDLPEYYEACMGKRKPYFSDPVTLQRTWSAIIWMLLGIEGNQNPTTLDAENFQKSKLGTKDGNNRLLELFPLPSPSTDPEEWPYHDWVDTDALTYLASRDEYERHWKKQRALALRKLIVNSRPRPRLVVLYGSRKRMWSIIAGRSITPGKIVRQSSIRFACVYHPGHYFADKKDYYLEMGRKLHDCLNKGT